MSLTQNALVRFALAILICFTAVSGRAPAIERADIMSAFSSITKDEITATVDVLADDSFEGREAGSRGGRAAGGYLMKEFEKHGLVPAGDAKSYFQAFRGSSRNILGMLEGSDPALKDEIILIGAHYDHVGYGRPNNSFGPFGYIHNGADDNASGVSGLLQILDAFKHLPEPPRRSVLFALWDAEEQGLLGSQHWLGAPTVSVDRIACAVNLDMIGRLRNSRVEVYGTRTAYGLRRAVSEANRDTDLDLDYTWKMKADSDHWPFFTRSIPILMFHTGLHEHYHRPSDDPPTLNADGMASVSQLAFLTVLDLANQPTRTRFRPASRTENSSTQAWFEQPIAQQSPRFGVPFEVIPGDPPRFVLTSVTNGSPAQRAGLRAGDEIISFRGEAVTDEAKFRLRLLAADGESAFVVKRAGSSIPVVIKVTPDGKPIRVGISWRADEADYGSLLLTQVVYGSPAHLAGLQLKDRIYALNGESFAGGEEFSKLINTLPGPLEMWVDRGGKLLSATVNVLPVEEPAE